MHNRLSYHAGKQPAQGRITVAGWFASLLDRIPPEEVAGVETVIQFDITGVNGCKKYLLLGQNELDLLDGNHQQPAVTITADSADWLSLINGDTSPAEMFLSGTLQIGGNFDLIVGLVDAFRLNPPGKYQG